MEKRMDMTEGNVAKMVKDALAAYDSIGFFHGTWSAMCVRWPDGKRKHWQKRRIADYEGCLNNSMDKFERLSSELDRMAEAAGISIKDGRFWYNCSPKRGSIIEFRPGVIVGWGLQIPAAEQQAIQEWLLIKEQLKNKGND